MIARLHSIVEADDELTFLHTRLNQVIERIDNSIDVGWLYVVADGTLLLEHAAHYLIYGSEWISAELRLNMDPKRSSSGGDGFLEFFA